MKVAQIAARFPATVRVFQEHGIDFCCGGGRTLQKVAEEDGFDLPTLSAELESAIAGATADELDWNEAPLDELADYIVGRFHESLRRELPRLAAMAEKVERVHGERFPDMLPELRRTFDNLAAELDSHTMKEEQILFPAIRQLSGRSGEPNLSFGIEGPIAVMEMEHQDAAEALAKMRELTDGYTVPASACNTFRALFFGLDELERETKEHIHMENNILFPRALSLFEEKLSRTA